MGNCEGNQILQDTHLPILGRLGPVIDLKVINYVWERDYQGLFDYQSRQIRKHMYHVRQNSLLSVNRQQKMIQQISKQQYTQSILKKACFQIIKKSNYFQILPIYIENEQFTYQKLLWLIIKTVPCHKYQLKEKDILKLGKQKIKVRQIVHLDNNSSLINHSNIGIKTKKKIYNDISIKVNPQQENLQINPKEEIVQQLQSVVTENQISCRICLEPGEYSNPLICACKCTGSIKYIHLNCLRTWLGKQLKILNSKFAITIKWTPLACEMCKTHYKYRIYLDNKKFYTVQIPKPEKPYIVLQVIKKNAQYSKIFHFISFSQNSKLSIGRKKDIDIKISDDISISRHHANLIYDLQNKRFLLQDNKSKFGSLVLIKKNLLINPFQKGIGFQMGGEIFLFQAVRGEGSIDDYQDHQEFLNVKLKDQKNNDKDQSSDQNNDDDDEQFQQQQEEEGIVQANPNLNHIGSNNSNIVAQNNNHNEQNNVLPVQNVQINQNSRIQNIVSNNMDHHLPLNNSNNVQIVQLDQ